MQKKSWEVQFMCKNLSFFVDWKFLFLQHLKNDILKSCIVWNEKIFRHLTLFFLFFVPRRNEVAEGGYWITLRQSVSPAFSLEYLQDRYIICSICKYGILPLHLIPTSFGQAISDGDT